MTAIALVLAIFKYRPSPFCLLDEVDAPLDDANVGRFAAKIAEMSERTQFIVITHNKRTMQTADKLFGVTMQERGVSMRVAVKFDQVGKDGAIASPTVTTEHLSAPTPGAEATPARSSRKRKGKDLGDGTPAAPSTVEVRSQAAQAFVEQDAFQPESA
jgi:energy-coupling factor transporter ATP-binding protein EcfA2